MILLIVGSVIVVVSTVAYFVGNNEQPCEHACDNLVFDYNTVVSNGMIYTRV